MMMMLSSTSMNIKDEGKERGTEMSGGRMVREGGGACTAGWMLLPSVNSTLCILAGNPLPVVAHGTQRFKAAARHAHVAYDVGW